MKSPFSIVYLAMEVLAGLGLISILLLVLVGVVLRFAGHQFAGSDDLSGFCLVAVIFLGLAPTYRRGEHIRVGLVIDRLTGRARRGAELVIVAASLVCTAWATWWIGRMVYDSWRFNDVTQGLLAIPLWIPQFSMVLGAAGLSLALAEDLVNGLRGRTPSHASIAHTDPGETPVFER
jgi:TRAP-type C4-dicarboxylate transport system permease small subunit